MDGNFNRHHIENFTEFKQKIKYISNKIKEKQYFQLFQNLIQYNILLFLQIIFIVMKNIFLTLIGDNILNKKIM